MRSYASILVGLLWLVAGASPVRAQAATPAASENGAIVDGVVASVDGSPITMFELEQFGEKQGRLLPPAEQANQAQLLDAMIRSMMFQAEFKEKGIVGTDSDVEAYIDNVLAQSGSSRKELTAALDELGLTWDIYFERMREEVQRLALINREIRARVNVTPEEVERYWEESSEFQLPARVEISDIFLPMPKDPLGPAVEMVRQQAEKAHTLAKRKGFAEAAREYSKGPTAAEGGKLGEFAEGTMAPQFEEQLAKLDEGGISDPFEVGDAIHIIKLDRRLSGGRVPLEQVEQKIREKLYVENLDRRFKRWVDEDLSNRHHVTNNLSAVSNSSTP